MVTPIRDCQGVERVLQSHARQWCLLLTSTCFGCIVLRLSPTPHRFRGFFSIEFDHERCSFPLLVPQSILVSFPPVHWPFIDGASYTLLDVKPEGRVAGTGPGTFLWSSVGLGHAVKTIVPSVYIIPDVYTLAYQKPRFLFLFISKSRLPGQVSFLRINSVHPVRGNYCPTK